MLDRNSYVPLYVQLEEEILRQIQANEIKPGEKLESESEMMKKYDIGRSTVRMALSQLVNKGYLEKTHGKGTFCKAIELLEKPLNIDVILDMSDTYFFPYYMRSISEVLTKNKCNFIVSDSKNNSNEIYKILKNILQKGTSGVILQPSLVNDKIMPDLEECFKAFQNAGIPCIMIDSAYNIPNASYLMMDEYRAGQMAAQYFMSLGHDRTLAVYMDFTDSVSRLNGFCDIYSSAKKEAPIKLLYDSNGLEKDLLSIIAEQKPTAIFCYNDGIAADCVRILHSNNIKVPEDISVMGVDDTVLATSCIPPLTTIIHPKQELGTMAAEALLEFIRKERTWPYVNLVSPSLAIRESCAYIK